MIRKRFVCRAADLGTFEANGTLNGLQFGKRSSGTVDARLYNKTIEIVSSGARVLEGNVERHLRPRHAKCCAWSSKCCAAHCASSVSTIPTRFSTPRAHCGRT